MEPRKLEGDAIPERIRALPNPPSELWVAGNFDAGARAIAIVGSRKATEPALGFAWELAREVAMLGVAVISGGALGIDAAAHRGAMEGGATWCVAPTGHRHASPPTHAPLFDEIVNRGGSVVWPFPPSTIARTQNFHTRNGVLVALAHAVVVVQAGLPSGTMNAAAWCQRLGRPLYIVGVGPWDTRGFDGSRLLLEHGGRPVFSLRGLLVTLGLTKRGTRDRRVVHGLPAPPPPLTGDRKTVFDALASEPLHLDEVVLRSALATSAVTTALLTLALENVVVEGPPGFFRRANATQTLNIPIDIVEGSQRHLDG